MQIDQPAAEGAPPPIRMIQDANGKVIEQPAGT